MTTKPRPKNRGRGRRSRASFAPANSHRVDHEESYSSSSSYWGGVAGLAIGLLVKAYFLDPYLASLLEAKPSIQDNQVLADNLRRDQMVAEHLVKLDASTKKAACEGYIGGLKEQNLTISPIINEACAGS